MEYTAEIKNGILVLSLNGDLIGEVKGPQLLEEVNNALNQGVVLCAVDISEVRYINSSGIGVLITVLTKFRNKDGELCLLKPSESVKKLLIITKLNAIFTIVDTQEEAETALKN